MVAARDSAIAAVALLAAPAYTLQRVSASALEAVIARTPTLSASEAEDIRRRAAQNSEQRLTEGPWYRAAFSYDPLPAMRGVRTPVLLLHGDADTQITPEQADTLADALRGAGNQAVSVLKFPDTNHLFLEDSDGRAFQYDQLPSHDVRREVLGALADWLLVRLQISG